MTVQAFVCNPFRENTYVVFDEASREAAIIDCGCLYENEACAVKRFVDDNDLKIRHIINTHLHLDHAFGNAWAAETFGVLPVAHRADEVYLEHFDEQLALFGVHEQVQPQPLGGYLAHGDELRLGASVLRVIETPGHTLGGVCFYAADANLLFSGDTLFRNSIGRTDLSGGNMHDLLDSISNRLFALPDDTEVYCGHGCATTIGWEKRHNLFLRT